METGRRAGSDSESRVRLLLDSLEIYSPTGAEAPMASFLSGAMERLGYHDIRIDGAGNVLGEVGEGDVSLLLCGHMDTVPGMLPLRESDGKIFGRGAADAKAPLCALVAAGAGAKGAGVKVTFAGVTEEEGDGRGVRQLVAQGLRPDFAVFGEPAGADKITVGYRGRVGLEVLVKTAGGHAGSPWAHRSAYGEFASLMDKLGAYERSKEVKGDRFRSLSISPTIVKAGTFPNVVPQRCEATLDLRLPPTLASSAALEDIRSIAGAPKDGVEVRVIPGEPTEAYEADPGSVLVRSFQRAIILGIAGRPKLIRKTATGDMNTFAHATGAGCLTYGPGISATSHTDGESVLVDDYLDSIEVLKGAIGQLGRMAEGRRR